MRSLRRIVSRMPLRALAMLALVAGSLTSQSQRPYSRHEKAAFADAAAVQFVRPGLVFKITQAQIAADGSITATVSITDPQGLPLDRTGALTPGTVSLSLVAAVIPKGQTQYVSYATRTKTSTITGNSSVIAAADSGGAFTQLGEGLYQYKFATRAPSGFDTNATHTIGVYGSRDLSAFDMGKNYASATFNFVPNGSPVTVTRDVVRTEGCNSCHDQLSAHGGSRRGVEMCVLCHTPQTTDPDTGTVDFTVMTHKIHMGGQLPSVIAGKKYQIGLDNAATDFSTVNFPAGIQRCNACHINESKAAQANAHLTKPSRVACGACHDDVNFATGDKHAGGPQISDNLCATCHIPQGEIDFDASIKGAHVTPTESSLLGGLAVNITKVTGSAGAKPVVSFTIKDNSGNAVAPSNLGFLNFTLAGPTTDYGNTSFGSDVTTPGYVAETAQTAANCGADGSCIYTFSHSIPADAKGTFVIGVESRRTEVVLQGTTKERSIQYGAKNQVVSFSVDGSPIVPRRTVVSTANCNACHVALSAHGTLRNQTEYCVLCHNPSDTDSARRVGATVAADKALPAQGIDFNLMIHRIHTGENLPKDRPYVVVGFGGTHNDFSDVRFPAMSPTGTSGDTRNCSNCHVSGSELKLPNGLNPVTDPQGPLSPNQPVTAACTGCHVSLPTLSHAVTNTTRFGESCQVCHGTGSAYAVDKVHAQY